MAIFFVCVCCRISLYSVLNADVAVVIVVVVVVFYAVSGRVVGWSGRGMAWLGGVQLSQTEESLRQERIFINKINLVSCWAGWVSGLGGGGWRCWAGLSRAGIVAGGRREKQGEGG